MCSYFFLSTFLATLNTSTSKSKSIGKHGRSKREEEEKKKEKKDEGEEKKKVEKVEVDRKPAKTLSSQIPKKTSPKKPLVPVKEEPSLKKENGKMGNCKYAIHTCYNAT